MRGDGTWNVRCSLLGASSTIKVAAPAVIQHNYLIFSYFYDRLTELGMVGPLCDRPVPCDRSSALLWPLRPLPPCLCSAPLPSPRLTPPLPAPPRLPFGCDAPVLSDCGLRRMQR